MIILGRKRFEEKMYEELNKRTFQENVERRLYALEERVRELEWKVKELEPRRSVPVPGTPVPKPPEWAVTTCKGGCNVGSD